MATHEKIYDALARHDLAEQTAKKILLSDEEAEILDSFDILNQREQKKLAKIYGGMGQIPVDVEESLIERLREQNPQAERLLDRIIPAIDRILSSGRG